MSNKIDIKLKVWRQNTSEEQGDFIAYDMQDINPHMSFLELLDVLNEKLINENEDPIAFEHDCREGICGSCAMTINGEAHGPVKSTTACQLHMFNFKSGDTITVEPWRASSFPVLKDLVTDRSSFDKIIQAGGYVSVNTGSAPDGNAIPIERDKAILAQFSSLPQGRPEQKQRVLKMVKQMDDEGFGHCTNTGACEATCPKDISIKNIGIMNKEYLKALID